MNTYNVVGRDPLQLTKVLWPQYNVYREQRQIIESVWQNDETFVPAGNMLGRLAPLGHG